MHEEVSFFSDGIKLDARLFLPAGLAAGQRSAAVVLCAGIQGVKELGPLDLAERLAQAGVATLAFDYRGFGASEGPRWRLFPHEQVRDVRAALSFLAGQPQVVFEFPSMSSSRSLTTPPAFLRPDRAAISPAACVWRTGPAPWSASDSCVLLRQWRPGSAGRVPPG